MVSCRRHLGSCLPCSGSGSLTCLVWQYLVEGTIGWYHRDMNVAVQDILNTVLQLPEKDRADLAASLIKRLDRPFDTDSQTAWAAKISRHPAELDSGVVRPIPWKEARQVIFGRVA
jgi:hypothetical protein